MIKITDEMVLDLAQAMWEGDYHEVGFWEASAEAKDSTLNMAHAAIHHLAPLIAKAEAEECALICQRSIDTDNAFRGSSQVSAEDVMIAVLTAKDIQIAIRARFKTASEPKSEE